MIYRIRAPHEVEFEELQRFFDELEAFKGFVDIKSSTHQMVDLTFLEETTSELQHFHELKSLMASTNDCIITTQKSLKRLREDMEHVRNASNVNGRPTPAFRVRENQINVAMNTFAEVVKAYLDVESRYISIKQEKVERLAQIEIKLKEQQEKIKMSQVYEREKFDSVNRRWKPKGLVLCSDPNVMCPDLFDPAAAFASQADRKCRWLVDYSVANIDTEGWTYGADFATLNKNGSGDRSAKLNSYVRRRKWKRVDCDDDDTRPTGIDE